MKWSHIKKVSPTDLDLNYIASPSAYLRYMQEAAHMHMMDCPPTPDELKAEHKVFVLSRVSLSVHRPLRACDTVRVSTWACTGHGATFPRCAEITRGDETAAVLASEWALLNTDGHTLCRAADYPHDFSPEAPAETELPVRFRMPRDAVFEYAGDYTAMYGDVDLNHHVNNARYPDIFCGYLPTMEGMAVKAMTISYIHEIPPGTAVKIYTASVNEGFGVRSVLPDGTVSAEAYIVLTPVDKI